MSWWNHRHLLGYAYDETAPPKVTSPGTSLGGRNAAIWLAQKISIFWWDFLSDSKLTTTNIRPVTETRFRKHARRIGLGVWLVSIWQKSPVITPILNLMKNLIAWLTFFQPIRMLHFEEFSTKLTRLTMKNQTKNPMDLWCIDISNFKLMTTNKDIFKALHYIFWQE